MFGRNEVVKINDATIIHQHATNWFFFLDLHNRQRNSEFKHDQVVITYKLSERSISRSGRFHQLFLLQTADAQGLYCYNTPTSSSPKLLLTHILNYEILVQKENISIRTKVLLSIFKYFNISSTLILNSVWRLNHNMEHQDLHILSMPIWKFVPISIQNEPIKTYY
jgi:hypothetical protein